MSSSRSSAGSDAKCKDLEVADSVHHPVKGIRNHGNTCFFNAMLQAVNQTDEFHNMYVMKPYEKKYPILDKEYSVSVPQPNEVANTLCQTFHLFTNGDNQPISTNTLLKRLGKRHPRFVRGTQEDSHEVLRALLDDIKSEEIENVKKEISSQFDAKCDTSFQDGEQNLELKSHLRMASKVDVAINKAVQGTVVSVVICHECHSIVENLEPFFDLSLPIVTNASIEKMSASANEKGAQDEWKNPGTCEKASKHSVPGNRKRKLNSTDDIQTKRRKTCIPLENVPSCTSHDDDSSQAVVHNNNIFQEYLKRNGYKHLYCHSTQMSTAQKFHTDLERCLLTFTDLDVLDEDNKFICKSCTERKHHDDSNEAAYTLCRVSKQLMIHQLPPVLILHIKRFEIGHYRVTKDSRYVSFPEVLNLAPYCTVDCLKERGDSNNQILYGLYAVVVHHGSSLHSGHYISYVKTRPSKAEDKDGEYCRTEYNRDYCNEGQWYLANDTYIHKCQFENVQDNQAYMLFYELLPLKYHHQIPDSDKVI